MFLAHYDPVSLNSFKETYTFKIILIAPYRAIKMYLYVYMPSHVPVNKLVPQPTSGRLNNRQDRNNIRQYKTKQN
jgi:hypothetical protein